MDTTTETQKDRPRGVSYSFADSLHDELQKLANARFNGNRSAMAEYLVRLGEVADSEKTLPSALVKELSELAGRQGLPFLKALENTVIAGLPLQREAATAASKAQ